MRSTAEGKYEEALAVATGASIATACGYPRADCARVILVEQGWSTNLKRSSSLDRTCAHTALSCVYTDSDVSVDVWDGQRARHLTISRAWAHGQNAERSRLPSFSWGGAEVPSPLH